MSGVSAVVAASCTGSTTSSVLDGSSPGSLARPGVLLSGHGDRDLCLSSAVLGVGLGPGIAASTWTCCCCCVW